MESKSHEELCPKEWLRGAIIGAGAFGTVRLAMKKSNGELYALKSAAEGSVSSLENEFNILTSLDSPYILKCLGKEYGSENGAEVCNLMMEFMAGGSVGNLLCKFGGQLDESVIRSYTRGILRGLDYLHRQGIVHCDIKCKNVLVGCGGVVKLGDFGSAKRTEERGVISGLRGTPLWMAPEVVNEVEQGPPSDIWSLGCTVVEMATGRAPWTNVSNPLSALYRIGCTDELPELPACLSPQGRDFLEKCFRRDPKQRWTAAQLLKHPFLSHIDFCSEREVKEAPLSPTSTLDWDSASSSTLPILTMASVRTCVKYEAEEKKEAVKRPSFSAKDRLAALAVGCEKSDWCSSPTTGLWIVVRSSPPFSGTANCSAGEESKSIMEGNDGENKEFTHEISEPEASGKEYKDGCELHPKLLIDQTSVSCQSPSQIPDTILGRVLVCTCSAAYYDLFDLQNWPKKPMNGQLHISSRAVTTLFRKISKLILIHFIWITFADVLGKFIFRAVWREFSVLLGKHAALLSEKRNPYKTRELNLVLNLHNLVH